MSFLKKLLFNLPEVAGPTKKKLTFKEKLKWTGIILIIFFDKCERQRLAFACQDLPDSRQDIPRIYPGLNVTKKTSPSNRFIGFRSNLDFPSRSEAPASL